LNLFQTNFVIFEQGCNIVKMPGCHPIKSISANFEKFAYTNGLTRTLNFKPFSGNWSFGSLYKSQNVEHLHLYGLPNANYIALKTYRFFWHVDIVQHNYTSRRS